MRRTTLAKIFIAPLLLLGLVLTLTTPARADTAAPYPGTVTFESKKPFKTLVDDLKKAIGANKMGLVAQACADCGARSIGKTIPGNRVIMAFNPHFAVRMLNANLAAGIEAPIRFYITENADGSAALTYRTPTSVFAPYKTPTLDVMARELDPIFEKIAADALR
ncbi:MAG: DUF302 domain-containing protein [Alphaproteobacteria bacterium]|nr:DUF302 domain-containing protein [Alphaproteobacteria bacterium]